MIKKIFCFLVIGLGSLTAQSFSGKLNPYTSASSYQPGDTIRILAVLADFQEDRDGSTYGNGKFGSIYSSEYGSSIIDPLPHDKAYFENHLLFVRNYFLKVSRGMANISFNVLPDIITVSKTMRNYSPAPRSNDLSPIAEFSKEVWYKADSIYPSFNFSEYDLFLVFHAGVGRDISLPGSLGLERDLPSVYLSANALQQIYGSSFTGFPVNSGTFTIKNTAVIPETESRELASSISGTFLFELSINGLLAATVGSHLGLPDLFNTETGLSAIGRFGLMDGQSIFAYNGLYPPEPSAWEKYYLGWVTPSEASLDKNYYSLSSFNLAGISDTSLLKINLSSTEYYLIENRQRDALGDFSTITFISQGQERSRTFLKDTTGYYTYDIDSLEGVIVNVDEFDWALPGSGILIWHIDENIIEQKISVNKVNADPLNRGVDLEEADGIQDIGVEFQTILGDVVIGEGEQGDYWYSSNKSDLYQNRFSSDTRPGTKTNTGANSLITISEFSDISGIMTFRVIFGDTLIQHIASTQIPVTAQEVFLSSYNENIVLSTSHVTYILSKEGEILDSVVQFSSFKPALYSDILIGANQDLNIFNSGSGIYPGRSRENSTGQEVNSPDLEITSSPVVISPGRVLLGKSNGTIYLYGLNDSGEIVLIDSTVFPGINDIMQIAADGSYFSAIAKKGLGYVLIENSGIETSLDFTPDQLILTKNASGNYVSVISSASQIVVASQGQITARIMSQSSNASGLAVADLKQDGNNYIIFNEGSKIKVYNLNGAAADNFPFEDPLGLSFDKFILASDFEGDKASEILAATLDGRIFAIDGRSGKIIRGFPLSTGKRIKSWPVLYNSDNGTHLSVLDSLNMFYTWRISPVSGKLIWTEYLGDNTNRAYSNPAMNTNQITDFFPVRRIYNYPNPVYDGSTFIRYYVAENSKINIRIFDLAGALVTELNSDAVGGVDNETEWNVTGIQSGVYLARIEASGSSGKSDTKIIKIAVVK